ncbi:MAG: AAA family ATPase [Candidatus Thermoplasmatota archaeon]|nr:AAA family ATPase [Candidatus Thermoplasmatota archaeon]
MEANLEDSVYKHREVLTPDYIPNHFPNRMDEIKTISQLIYDFLQGNATHVFIHGPPGTGKTASVKFIFKSLMEQKEALASYVNCFKKNTRMAVLYSIFLDFFKEKRPTRRMPCRRGIAYDELLDSFIEELAKAKVKVVVCLDEVDHLEDNDLVYDLARARSEGVPVQIIAISNDPLVFRNLDPRAKSSLFPIEEIAFNPYTKKEMKEIIEARVEAAFREGAVTKEAIDVLAEFTAEHKGDVRMARETLLRAGDLARKSHGKVEISHIKDILKKTQHARFTTMLSALSEKERFILKLIPDQGVNYPQLYDCYRTTNGNLGDRMFRNYVEKFAKLRLINMERKGNGGAYFITLNTPKEVLFETS